MKSVITAILLGMGRINLGRWRSRKKERPRGSGFLRRRVPSGRWFL